MHESQRPAAMGRQAVFFGGVDALALGVAQHLIADSMAVTFVTDDADGSEAGGVTICQADLLDPEALAARVAELPAFDLAILSPRDWRWGDFLATSDAAWQTAVQQNIEAMVWATQAAARHMIAQGRGGRIIGLLSHTAVMPFIGASALGTTHTALWAVLKMAAVELAPHAITCNGIAIGWTEARAAALTPAQQAHIERGIPVGRLVKAADVGALVHFLASEAAASLTGALIPLDGGYTLTRSDGESALEG